MYVYIYNYLKLYISTYLYTHIKQIRKKQTCKKHFRNQKVLKC